MKPGQRLSAGVFLAANTTKETGLAKLSMSVVEPYFTLLDDIISTDEKDSTNLSLSQILDQFQEKVSSSNFNTNLSVFQSRRQKTGETGFAYGLKLQQLSQPCFSGIDENIVDQIVLHKYLDGLSNPLKSQLRLSMPKSMAEAINNTLILEGSNSRNDITTNQIKQEPRPMYTRDVRMNQYKGKMPIVRNFNSRNFENKDTRNDNKMDRNTDRVSAIDMANVRCYKCQKLGHFKSQCPTNTNTPKN